MRVVHKAVSSTTTLRTDTTRMNRFIGASVWGSSDCNHAFRMDGEPTNILIPHCQAKVKMGQLR